MAEKNSEPILSIPRRPEMSRGEKARILVEGMTDIEIFELMQHVAKRLNRLPKANRITALDQLFNHMLPEDASSYADKLNKPIR